jgi:hypothetical protein
MMGSARRTRKPGGGMVAGGSPVRFDGKSQRRDTGGPSGPAGGGPGRARPGRAPQTPKPAMPEQPERSSLGKRRAKLGLSETALPTLGYAARLDLRRMKTLASAEVKALLKRKPCTA